VRMSLRRLWLAGLLITAFLTVQLAAAAYACTGNRYSLSQTDDMAGMTESCPEMAEKAANTSLGNHDGLCLEHCQLGSKAADHVTPQIPAFLPVLVSFVEPAPVSVLAWQSAALSEAIPRAPPPPIPILNCCFRT